MLCTKGVKLRKVEFFAPIPLDTIQSSQLKVLRTTDNSVTLQTADPKKDFSEIYSADIMNHEHDNKNGFVAIMATGQKYNLHFKEGIDFSHLLLATS